MKRTGREQESPTHKKIKSKHKPRSGCCTGSTVSILGSWAWAASFSVVSSSLSGFSAVSLTARINIQIKVTTHWIPFGRRTRTIDLHLGPVSNMSKLIRIFNRFPWDMPVKTLNGWLDMISRIRWLRVSCAGSSLRKVGHSALKLSKIPKWTVIPGVNP